jgi:hypothetical protein
MLLWPLFVLSIPFGPHHAVALGPCVTSRDSLDLVQSHFANMVAKADSTTLARLGLPYRPAAGVAGVTEADICRTGIAAYNALYPDSAEQVQRAVVVQVGEDRYVLWAVRERRRGPGRDLYFVFDPRWHLVKLLT